MYAHTSYSPSTTELGGIYTETICIRKLSPVSTDTEFECEASGPAAASGSGGETRDVMIMKVILTLSVYNFAFEIILLQSLSGEP